MEFFFLKTELRNRIVRRLETKIKVNDWISMVLALAGTLMAVAASNFYQMPKSGFALENEVDFRLRDGVNEETMMVTILRSLVTITTMVLLFFIYRHYKLDLDVLKTKEHIDHYETLFTSGKYKYLLLELILCLIHSPPRVNAIFTFTQEGNEIEYSLDMFCTFVTLTRVYSIWRLFAKYSTWNNDKAEKVCLECHCQSGTGFAIKCELKERPYTIILVAIIISIFIFGFAIRAAELPYMAVSGEDWTYLWNSMWCTIITMATVGYGDFVPKTHIGRCIAILACIWGNFLISLMVVSLTISSEFNPSQRKAYDNIMKEIGIQEHNRKAMRVVQTLLRYSVMSKKKKDMTKEERIQHLNSIRDRIKDFQQHRKKLFVKDQEIPLENQLLRVNQKISFEFDQVLSDARSIKKTMTVLSRAEDLNREIEEKAIKVTALSDKILSKLRKFKENKFRPRIQGFDSDSDGEGDNGDDTKKGRFQQTAQPGLKRERSPTKFLNKMNSLNEEEDNIALLKLIRGGYIDQNVLANLINNVIVDYSNTQGEPKASTDKSNSNNRNSAAVSDESNITRRLQNLEQQQQQQQSGVYTDSDNHKDQ